MSPVTIPAALVQRAQGLGGELVGQRRVAAECRRGVEEVTITA